MLNLGLRAKIVKLGGYPLYPQIRGVPTLSPIFGGDTHSIPSGDTVSTIIPISPILGGGVPTLSPNLGGGTHSIPKVGGYPLYTQIFFGFFSVYMNMDDFSVINFALSAKIVKLSVLHPFWGLKIIKISVLNLGLRAKIVNFGGVPTLSPNQGVPILSPLGIQCLPSFLYPQFFGGKRILGWNLFG